MHRIFLHWRIETNQAKWSSCRSGDWAWNPRKLGEIRWGRRRVEELTEDFDFDFVSDDETEPPHWETNSYAIAMT